MATSAESSSCERTCCSNKLKKALFLAKNKPESLLAFDCNSLEKNDAYSTQSCAFNAFATPSMVCLMPVSSVDKFDEGSALVPYIVGLSAIALVANKETRTKTSKITFIFISPKIGSFCSDKSTEVVSNSKALKMSLHAFYVGILECKVVLVLFPST